MTAAAIVKPALAALMLLLAGAAAAQGYPVKPLRLIVGFAPGGTVDIVARATAQGMRDVLGQQVIVDNRAGANGAIGTEAVAKAPPDGYTIGLGSISTLVLNVHLNSKTPYQTLRDFTPIGRIGEVPSAIAMNPAVPVRSMKQLIALARSQPRGKILMGSSGVGGIQHLTIEVLNNVAGIGIEHVAYKGAVPALTDVLGGHIDGLIVSLPSVIGPANARKLNIIAVTGDQRSPALPEVPTAKEQGLPDLVIVNWYALVGPANLPALTVTTLHGAIAKAVASPGLKERFAAAGIEPRTEASPAVFSRFLADEFTRWQKIISHSGVKIE